MRPGRPRSRRSSHKFYTSYLVFVSLFVVGIQFVFSDGIPSAVVEEVLEGSGPRIFDCFLYHNEAYMLYLHLLTVSPKVSKFILGFANVSFTDRDHSPVTYHPFESDIFAYSSQILFLFIDLLTLPESKSRYRNTTAWHREATARNYLIEGVKRFSPLSDDLVLLCDVDEIPTRGALEVIRSHPPLHYYNLHGLLFHYSFRWQVGEWNRPMVLRYGSIVRPLDDYKFMPFRVMLPGVLHYHCSFCSPTVAGILYKLASFSHTEYSEGRFTDPNYVYARIACGFGVLPRRWKMPERLTLVDFDAANIFLPDDDRISFFRYRLGFMDLDNYSWNRQAITDYMPGGCPLKSQGLSSLGRIP
jgi:hypothetical protein